MVCVVLVYVHACVCARVCEEERERERGFLSPGVRQSVIITIACMLAALRVHPWNHVNGSQRKFPKTCRCI